jgi:eukaryotic-like serine/threonine-protein kinase
MSTANQPAPRHPQRLGKYEIVRHIASGGMGSVYKAIDSKLGRPVALKVLQAEFGANPVLVERFHREAKAAARLTHENIVTLLDDGEVDGTHYLVMEFVDGIDLNGYILKKRRLDPEEARQILIQATRALDHAHRQGIVHRDIKPANFLLTKKDGKLLVKLTDMGLARRVDEQEFRVTRDGTTVGTIDYISPEQAHDSQRADIRSDIYSLGCTFFHMLSGNPPFPTGSLPERLLHHIKSTPPDICSLNGKVPRTFEHILKRMLAKKPSERYQTPRELLKDLEHPEKIDVVSKSERLASLEDLARAETDEADEPDDDESEPEDSRPIPSRRPRPKVPQAEEEDEPEEEETEDETPSESGPIPWWAWVVMGGVGIVLFLVVWQIVKFQN